MYYMAKSSNPVNSILAKPFQVLLIRLMYIALLIAFLVIGYLLGQIQGGTGSSLLGNNNSAAPSAPSVANPAAPGEPIFAEVDNGNLPVQGNENAPVTIIEFSDFECPFCGQFYTQSLPQVITDYIDTGKAKLYYRHLPLSFHPQARPAALASECANEQDAFWEYHDTLFDNNATLGTATTAKYVEWATDLGLNASQFEKCLTSEKYAENVDGDTAAATAAGASGTPTFYINGQQLVGAQPFASFQAIIDAKLAK